jgi:hypothetical protein
MARIDRYGYGSIKSDGKTYKAHRMSYTMYVGEAPQGLYVLHRCDNRKCVNPNHLFLGTAADNSRDMVGKGRYAGGHWPHRTGQEHGRSKLSESDVIAIRADTRTQSEIAKQYGVGRTQISKIKNRENWQLI